MVDLSRNAPRNTTLVIHTDHRSDPTDVLNFLSRNGLRSLPEEGLEPSPCCQDGILNPARLPIPPLRQVLYSQALAAILAMFSQATKIPRIYDIIPRLFGSAIHVNRLGGRCYERQLLTRYLRNKIRIREG